MVGCVLYVFNAPLFAIVDVTRQTSWWAVEDEKPFFFFFARTDLSHATIDSAGVAMVHISIDINQRMFNMFKAAWAA